MYCAYPKELLCIFLVVSASPSCDRIDVTFYAFILSPSGMSFSYDVNYSGVPDPSVPEPDPVSSRPEIVGGAYFAYNYISSSDF